MKDLARDGIKILSNNNEEMVSNSDKAILDNNRKLRKRGSYSQIRYMYAFWPLGHFLHYQTNKKLKIVPRISRIPRTRATH